MKNLNERHIELLKYVADHPGLTAREIGDFYENHPDEKFQATDNATRCALRRLVGRKLVEYRSTKVDRQYPRYYVTTPSPVA